MDWEDFKEKCREKLKLDRREELKIVAEYGFPKNTNEPLSAEKLTNDINEYYAFRKAFDEYRNENNIPDYSRNFYISDLHIGHSKAIEYDERPFSSVDEMNYEIIRRWNDKVRAWDNVYILGDMFWKPEVAERMLGMMNGVKHLIRGNHDKITPEIEKYFISIDRLLEIKDGKKKVVLCHYPMAAWRGAEYGTIHLYGHIHRRRNNRPSESYSALMKEYGYECYNVGCMMDYMDYTPRTLAEITERFTNGNI